jgi:signal transduction histidine kinase
MRARLAISAAACAVGSALVAVVLGAHSALETLVLLLGVSAAALAIAAQARRARSRIRSLSWQLSLAVGIAAAAILSAVGLAAWLMFISTDDALVVSVMAVVIAVVGVCVAGLLTEPVAAEITMLRDRLREVGLGSRRADLATAGADELADLAAAANAMIEQLADEEAARAAANQARRGLITALSHDLRTPLAALQVLTEAVQDGIATGATRGRYLSEMQVHVAALSELIDELFALARAQAHPPGSLREEVEVGELVSETVTAMRATAERRGVSVASEPPAGQAHGPQLVARADRGQIRRVLLNLLDNAIRHTPAGGSVRARTVRRDDRVHVQVADEGEGIAPRDAERVFEAFYQGGDGSSRSGEGAGLGLAIARAIVDAHAGEIWIEQGHEGATVCFSLPAAPGSAGPLQMDSGAVPAADPGRALRHAATRQ